MAWLQWLTASLGFITSKLYFSKHSPRHPNFAGVPLWSGTGKWAEASHVKGSVAWPQEPCSLEQDPLWISMVVQIRLSVAPPWGGEYTVPIVHWEILLHPSPQAPRVLSPPRTAAFALPPLDCLTSAPCFPEPHLQHRSSRLGQFPEEQGHGLHFALCRPSPASVEYVGSKRWFTKDTRTKELSACAHAHKMLLGFIHQDAFEQIS